MHDRAALAEKVAPGFQPARFLLTVLAAFLFLSFAGDWYVGQVSLPRYCQQTELVLQRLAAIISEKRLAGDEARRDYIVAAKLEFLVPRAADEPLDVYLQRVRRRLEQQCS